MLGRPVIDEVGKTFGRLTVIERAANKKGGHAAWFCKCACGNEIAISGDSLRSGSTKSCGCLQKERARKANKLIRRHILPAGEAAFNALICRMRQGAKRRGYIWNLTKDQVRRLTSKSCYYCGVKPSQQAHSTQRNGVYLYNGLDRINNEYGYTSNNVVPACGTCNIAKQTMRQEEFLAWISRAYKHSISKG